MHLVLDSNIVANVAEVDTNEFKSLVLLWEDQGTVFKKHTRPRRIRRLKVKVSVTQSHSPTDCRFN